MSDSLKTVNLDILDKLVQKDEPRHTSSYMARIINKTMRGEYRKAVDKQFMRGHYSDRETVAATAGKLPGFTLDDMTVEMVGAPLLPATYGAEEILKALDEKIDAIDVRSLDLNTLLRLSAMLIIVVGTSHAFPDANGRTAVGLAKVFIDKYGHGKSLDLETVMTHNETLLKTMAVSSYFLLPHSYNPIEILHDMQTTNEKRRKVIFPRLEDDAGSRKFIYEYIDSIISFIKEYQFQPGNKDFYNIATQIDQLAVLLSKSLKKKSF